MIPVAKGHIYSYRDFNQEDLEVQPEEVEEIFIEDLRKTDSINYLDLTSAEYWEFVAHQWALFKKEFNKDCSCRNKYFMKEFCVNFSDPDSDVNEFINRYSLSDWNPQSKNQDIDDRTLKIELFSYIEQIDNLYQSDPFLIKAEHIYQLIKDLSKEIEWTDELIYKGKGNNLVSDRDLNLYVLPIYILDLKMEKYFRISEICYGKSTINEYHDLILNLYDALKAFVATNFYMLDLYNNNSKITVYNEKKKVTNNITFKAYAETATADKKFYSYIEKNSNNNYDPKIEIKINPDQENILANNVIPRKLCDYRFIVRGHYRNVPKGPKGNQHWERVWVNSYEKNKSKPYKIIKETKIK